MENREYDIVIIGAGILGTSLAYMFSTFTDYRVALIEKENSPAMHASSRNTGVIHRPFYLDPERKKIFAKAAQYSYSMWKELSLKYGLPWNQNGTIEVAVRESDLDVLQKYAHFSTVNGMDREEFEILNSSDVSRIEPSVHCKGAFYSKTDTGVSFRHYAEKLLELAVSRGLVSMFNASIEEISDEEYTIILRTGESKRYKIQFKTVINVAGGGSLELARRFGLARKYTVLHFRGDYWRVSGSLDGRIRRNIYSVPRHSKYPFLDPHFVIRHDGTMELGPNAALVAGPYGYLKGDPNRRKGDFDLFSRPLMPKLKLFTDAEFMSMVRQEWKSSTHRDAMIARISQFVSGIGPGDITGRGLSGIRHNLIDSRGFVPEAVIETGQSSLNVLNYNSPGATGAPAYSAYLIGRMIDAGLISGNRIKGKSESVIPWGLSFMPLLEKMS